MTYPSVPFAPSRSVCWLCMGHRPTEGTTRNIAQNDASLAPRCLCCLLQLYTRGRFGGASTGTGNDCVADRWASSRLCVSRLFITGLATRWCVFASNADVGRRMALLCKNYLFNIWQYIGFMWGAFLGSEFMARPCVMTVESEPWRIIALYLYTKHHRQHSFYLTTISSL